MPDAPSNMTHEEVKLWLRVKYNELFGPGYFPDPATENTYLYVWFYGSPVEVYIDIMAKHGGDDALRERAQGKFGRWV